MLYQTFSLSLLASTAAVVAGFPSQILSFPRDVAQTFSLQAFQPLGNSTVSLSAHLMRSYQKHGLEVPEELAEAAQRNAIENRAGSATDSVTIGNNWYAPITIGTPPQSFLTLPDSGAPDFFVISTGIPQSFRGGAPLYNPGASSSAKQMMGYSFQEEYASGAQVSGDVYTDVVTIGNLAIGNFAFEVANVVTEKDNGVRSGNWGLNFDHGGQETSPQRLGSWFQAAKNFLKAGVWTCDFHKDSTGTLDFGFIDHNKYTGTIGYAPVSTTNGLWEVVIGGFSVGSSGAFISTTFHTIIDTGTDASTIPKWVADIYFARVAGSVFNTAYQTYAYPCSAVLPSFTFGAGVSKITIPGSYLDYGTIDGGKTCISRLGTTTGLPLWGHTLIQAMFVVFDWDNSRVGFANKPL